MKKRAISVSLLKPLLLVLIISLFTLLWGEFFTRTLLPQNVDSRMNIFISDPMVGFTYKPGAKTFEKGQEYNALYQINSLGLRDREYVPGKSGSFRVLLLGDSFSVSHGLPIEDSLSRQLEKALQTALDSDGKPINIEIINAAAGGYSPYNYWKAYRRWAPVFKPDVVIVGLSPDDYDCSNEDSQYLIEDGATLAIFKNGRPPSTIKSSANFIRNLRKWLSWNSQFYILLRNYFYYNDIVGRIRLLLNPKGEEHNNQMQQFLVPQSESMAEAWSKTFSYLQKLKKDSESDGVVVIVVAIPLKIEIDPQEYQKTVQTSGLTFKQVDISAPLKSISFFCQSEKIPLLDPRRAIRKRHVEEPCYFVYDGHWTAEGIRIATVSIVSQWRDLGLPPWRNKHASSREAGN